MLRQWFVGCRLEHRDKAMPSYHQGRQAGRVSDYGQSGTNVRMMSTEAEGWSHGCSRSCWNDVGRLDGSTDRHRRIRSCASATHTATAIHYTTTQIHYTTHSHPGVALSWHNKPLRWKNWEWFCGFCGKQKKINERVLNKAGVKRELLDTVKARKLAYYGHTMRKQGS